MTRRPGRIFAGALLALAFAAPARADLPDLVSDAPADAVLQTYTAAGSSRLLLRFESYIHNAGTGPLEVRADVSPGPFAQATVSNIRQRVDGADTPLPGAQ